MRGLSLLFLLIDVGVHLGQAGLMFEGEALLRPSFQKGTAARRIGGTGRHA